MSNDSHSMRPTSTGMERKLAAIFSTDVAGYSRLMGDDEEATIRTLTTYRVLISSLIQHYRGRVVDAPGDNLLAEFASVVDAVRCAVEIQHALKEKNGDLPEHRRMRFRIGINLGDVIVEGERLYGDGVNIAARLESLAIPGGICLSGTAYDQVENKLALTYDAQGEQTVKNITKPVRVYRVVMADAAAALARQGRASPARLTPPRVGSAHRLWPVVALAGLSLLAGAFLTVRYLSHLSLSPQDSAFRTDAPPTALPLPDKPSIIVLPFVNMNKDPDQDYFSDGLTDTLTGDLSKISSLFVIARNSAFTYKGKAVKVQDVGREMGVRYVLEGSVLKADNQVRVNAQLIDTTTGYHLWSERYDRPLQNILTLQDEIVQRIVTTLQLQLTLAEQGVVTHKGTNNLEASDAYLRGVEAYLRRTQDANTQARQMCEKALALDPQYAEAYTLLGRTYLREYLWRWNQTPQTLEQALTHARQALAVDASLPMAHRLLAYVYLWQKQYDQAITEAEQALTLDPNDAEGYEALGEILSFAGRPADTLGLAEKGLRLNPGQPVSLLWVLGRAYLLTGRYDKAIAVYKQILVRNPNHMGAHLDLAAIYSELGREAEARAEMAELLRVNPNDSLAALQISPFKDPAVLERLLAAWRKAGLK